MYITSNESTNNYFHRFQTIKINDPRYNVEKTWLVVGVDPYYGDGIIQVFLDEYFQNPIEDAIANMQQQSTIENNDQVNDLIPYIDGPIKVTQYSKAYYSVKNITGGNWFINWDGQQYNLNYNYDILPLQIPTGELKSFILIYKKENAEDLTLQVTITAL